LKTSSGKQYIAYDTETTGLRPYDGDRMFCYSTCTTEGLKSARRIDGPKTRRLLNTRKLKNLWLDENTAKIFHNAKFDLTFTERFLGRRMKGEIHDTLAMSRILQNLAHSHALKHICWVLCGYTREDEVAVKGHGVDYSKVPQDEMDEYAANDAERTMLLFLLWWKEIQKDKGAFDAYNTEIALIRPTMAMEKRGVRLNPEATEKMLEQLAQDCKRLEHLLWAYAGGRFDVDSHPQLARILFDNLHLPVLQRTPTGKPSTGKPVLLQLRGKHKIINTLLKYRSYSKAIPIIRGYLDFAGEDNIIHPNILLTGADTGRQACTTPNLMNVSKEQVLLNPYPVAARRLFTPREGYENYHFDYAGEELRLLVHYHKDEEFRRILLANGDAHYEAAVVFYGKTKAAKKRYRDAAKNANFALGYGAGARKVAQVLGLGEGEMRMRLKDYDARFPRARTMAKRLTAQVRSQGSVTTEFGRKIKVNPNKPYVGVNYLIQGTGADIIKRAQVRIHSYLEKVGADARLIFPIHDELVIEIPKVLKDKKGILRGIRDLMEDFPQFSVPLKVECKISQERWSEKEEVKI